MTSTQTRDSVPKQQKQEPLLGKEDKAQQDDDELARRIIELRDEVDELKDRFSVVMGTGFAMGIVFLAALYPVHLVLDAIAGWLHGVKSCTSFENDSRERSRCFDTEIMLAIAPWILIPTLYCISVNMRYAIALSELWWLRRCDVSRRRLASDE